MKMFKKYFKNIKFRGLFPSKYKNKEEKIERFKWLINDSPIREELQSLFLRVLQIKKGYDNKKYFCANKIWYGKDKVYEKGLKKVVCDLVGIDSLYEELRNSDDYDIVYDVCYQNLPDCNHEPGFC